MHIRKANNAQHRKKKQNYFYDTRPGNEMELFYNAPKPTNSANALTNLQQTRSQAVARIADRTVKNCKGHVT